MRRRCGGRSTGIHPPNSGNDPHDYEREIMFGVIMIGVIMIRVAMIRVAMVRAAPDLPSNGHVMCVP